MAAFQAALRASTQREIDALRASASCVARMGNEERAALKAELADELRADVLASLRVQLGSELTPQFGAMIPAARVDAHEAMSRGRAAIIAGMRAAVEHARILLAPVGQHMAEAKELRRKQEALLLQLIRRRP